MRHEDLLLPDVLTAEIARYKEWLAANPSSRAFGRLASAYHHAGHYREAIATCEAGLQVYPSFVGARLILARALRALGADLAQAEAEYLHVLQAAPDSLVARRELGDLLREQGRSVEALRVYGDLLELLPLDGEVRALVEAVRPPAAPAVAAAAPVPESLEAMPAFDLTEEAAQFEELALGAPAVEAVPEPAAAMPPPPIAPPGGELEPEPFIPIFDLTAELAREAGGAPEQPGEARGPVPGPPRAVLATETLAELYLQQGFRDEARAIYQELVRNDPTRADLQAKLEALQELPQDATPALALEGSVSSNELIDVLEAWLLAARGRRAELQGAGR